MGQLLVSLGHVRTSDTSKYIHERPFLVDLDRAVDRIYRAIAGRRPSLLFPMAPSLLVWVGQVLPRRLYDPLAGRIRRDLRE